MKSALNYFQLIFLLFLLFSCKKKDDINNPVSGQIKLNVQAIVNDFSENLTSGKMASNYSYEPNYSTTVNFNKDYILTAELLPISKSQEINSSRLLASNRNRAQTGDIDNGDVYRLLVYDNSGKFIAIRDYTRGSEENTEPLHLFRNTSYTFIAYSLNANSLTDLDQLLYINETQNPSLSELESNSTLSNTLIWGRGNNDLLFYRQTLTTKDEVSDYLQIVLKHQYNLVQMTLDVSNTGYGITDLDASLDTKSNSVQISFANGAYKRFNRTGYVIFNNFEYQAVNGVSNSIAISEPIIINAKSGENLLEIYNLKIGDVNSDGTVYPFQANGVTLLPGYQYNLSVKLTPKDSLYTLDGYPVARINGQVWMRHNLGANTNVAADIPNRDIQGDYFQWGKKFSFLSGTATSVSGYNTTHYNNYGPTNTSFFTDWNSGTETNPIKGTLDPCPAAFRLPTKTEYDALISNTTASKVTGNDTDPQFNNAMQLKSKRKSTVILTFPAQGYVGEAWNGSFYIPHSVSARGQSAYTKSSSYNNKGTSAENGITYIKFEYMLLQGLSSASIFVGPGGGKISAGTVGHPIRCIAISNSRISLNDREVDNSNGGSVGF